MYFEEITNMFSFEQSRKVKYQFMIVLIKYAAVICLRHKFNCVYNICFFCFLKNLTNLEHNYIRGKYDFIIENKFYTCDVEVNSVKTVNESWPRKPCKSRGLIGHNTYVYIYTHKKYWREVDGK